MKKILTAVMFAVVAFTFGVQSASAASMNLCTGSVTGKYFETGNALRDAVADYGLDITVLKTGGSYDNIENLSSGNCDAAIIQPNVWKLEAEKNPLMNNLVGAGALYKEYVHVFCNVGADIEDADDLEGAGSDVTIAIGNVGSGNAATWEDFVNEDDDYGDLKTKNIGDVPMVNAILSDQVQCGIVVSGKNSRLMNAIDARSDRINLVEMDDGDFNDAETPDGRKLYEFVEMTSDDYPGLIGFYDVETVAMSAMVVVTTDWIRENRTAFEETLSFAILNMAE